MDFSTNTWPTRLKRSPFWMISTNSSSLSAIPPPLPPRVYAGRRTTGYPIFCAYSRPSSTFVTIWLGAIGSPIFSIVSLNSSLSSALRIVLPVVPISFTLCSFKKPHSSNSIAIFNAACPPNVGRRLSGETFKMSFLITSGVNGSMYTSSAISLSVMIVAGLELTRTT